MKNWIATQELALALGCTARWLNQLADRQGFLYRLQKGRRGRGGKVRLYSFEDLPTEVRDKVIVSRRESLALSESEELKDLEYYPLYKQKIAEYRFYLLFKYRERLLEARRFDPSAPRGPVLDQFCRDYNEGKVNERVREKIKFISPRSMQRWTALYEDFGIEGLVPDYGKREGQTKIPEEEQSTILQLVGTNPDYPRRSIWTKLVNIRARKLQLNLESQGKEADFSACKRRVYQEIYHYTTVLRYVKRNYTDAELAYLKGGMDAIEQNFLPSTQRDPSTKPANWRWVADGTRLNLWALDPVTRRKVRPVLVAFMDESTRLVTGFSITASESTESVLAALANGIEKWGVPDSVTLDNGAAFKNKQTMGISRTRMKSARRANMDEWLSPAKFCREEDFVGAYGRYGIKVHFTTPYNPGAKRIEPFWGTLNDYAAMLFPTYCGRNITEKPAALPAILADAKNVPSFDELYTFLTAAFEEYNTNIHTGTGMNGRQPLEAWREGIAERGGATFLDTGKLALLRLLRDRRTVGKEGVQYENALYYHNGLVDYVGQTVEIGIDPQNLQHLYVFGAEGELLFRAERREVSKYDDFEQLRYVRSLHKDIKRLTKQKAKKESELRGVYITAMSQKDIPQVAEDNEKLKILPG